MAIEWILSFVVGAVASVVALLMVQRFLVKRQLHQALWALGLGMWAVSAFAQGAAILYGWTVASYKLYYFAAISLAGFLGAGTAGLILRRRKLFQGFVAYIAGVTVLFGVAVTLAVVNEGLLQETVVGGLAFPSEVRIWTPFINVPGGIAFIGGAAYGFFRTRRLFALLITLGALTPAIGGTLARFSFPWVLPFTDFVGIACLSAGVLLSMTPAEIQSAVASGHFWRPRRLRPT